MASEVERVSIFIDGANMTYAQKKLGWQIDFQKTVEYFSAGKNLINAFYYAREPQDIDEKRFYGFLTWTGYTVRTKPVKVWTDPSTSESSYKCNLDIEMVVDMFNTSSLYDAAIIFTGDGDFGRAVELLRSKGKRIIACSTQDMISYELANAVDKYVDLNRLRQHIERDLERNASD
ncbi:MAG: NYN domain-containing protein [Bacillota bacterium]